MIKILILKDRNNLAPKLWENIQKHITKQFTGAIGWEEYFLDQYSEYKLILNNTKKIVLLFAHDQTLLQPILNNPPKALVFFVMGANANQDQWLWIRKIFENDHWPYGVIDEERGIELGLSTVFQAIVKRDIGNQIKEFAQVSKGVNQIISLNLAQLQRIKKFHEKIVSLRQEQFKGVNLMSKYAAGESPGGEFFDAILNGHHLVVLLSSCNSYLASSNILTTFEKWKASQSWSWEDCQKDVFALANDFKSVGQNLEFELMLVEINLATLEIQGMNFGRGRLISQNAHYINSNQYPVDQAFLDKARFKFKLTRAEKLAVLSPGVCKNLGEDFIGQRSAKDFCQELLPKGNKTFLTELFFELKRDRRSDFLEHDASSIVIEVDANAIVKV